MDNVFISQFFDWNRAPSWKERVVNGSLAKLGIETRLTSPRSTGEQTTVEQRINLYHLAGTALAFGVPGALVELGTHRGSTAALLAKVIEQFDAGRELHVFDAFTAAPPTELLANFEALKLRAPVVHAGLFRDTIPGQLPDPICFAHVDVGWGQPAGALRDTVLQSLESVYPRMARQAVLVLADYCEPNVYERQGFAFPHAIGNRSQWNLYPAVKQASDAFFADKPESMSVLYSGSFSHGYFRKL